MTSASSNQPPARWYDRDPALQKALDSLRNAPSKYHAQVALNIINVVVEHLAEANNVTLEEQERSVQAQMRRLDVNPHRRRWYDVNETLRSALMLLQDMPEEVQLRLNRPIAHMIERTLERHGLLQRSS